MGDEHNPKPRAIRPIAPDAGQTCPKPGSAAPVYCARRRDAFKAFRLKVDRASHRDPISIHQKKDTWVAEESKLSENYVGIARDAYKPVEQAVAKRAPN
jgi:hypothetical protein